MADKTAEKKTEGPAPAPSGPKADASGKGGGMLGKTPVLLGVVMIVEAVILFAGFKFLGGGPGTSDGATLLTPESIASGMDQGAGTTNRRRNIEINVVDLRAPNKRSGRTFLYDVSIYLVTRTENETSVTDAIKTSEALIRDRVRTIIAQSDPEKLGGGSEPGLETLRRQVKYQLDEILGEGMIEEVLIPRCIPFRADF